MMHLLLSTTGQDRFAAAAPPAGDRAADLDLADRRNPTGRSRLVQRVELSVGDATRALSPAQVGDIIATLLALSRLRGDVFPEVAVLVHWPDGTAAGPGRAPGFDPYPDSRQPPADWPAGIPGDEWSTMVRSAFRPKPGGGAMDQGFDTMQVPSAADAIAPDGSDVRMLLRLARGSMAHFELGAGRVSRAVAHRSVEEIWYILQGHGQMWRGRKPTGRKRCPLRSGTCVSLPAGTHFQFRAGSAGAPLAAVGVTMPPWPGTDEAYEVPGAWPGGSGPPRATMRTMRVQQFRALVAAGPRGRAVIAVPFDPDAIWGARLSIWSAARSRAGGSAGPLRRAATGGRSR